MDDPIFQDVLGEVMSAIEDFKPLTQEEINKRAKHVRELERHAVDPETGEKIASDLRKWPAEDQ